MKSCLHYGKFLATILVACAILAGLSAAAAAEYLGPTDVVASPDGKLLYVVNSDARQIAVFDPATGQVARSIACPAKPTGLALSPDGSKLYVSCAAPQGSVVVIDAASGQAAATIPVGYWAAAPCVTPDGKRLYVCNRFNNDVSVIDLETNKELARVPMVREPMGSAVTPDGKTVFITNLLPNDASSSYDVAAHVTAIDTATNETTQIRLPNGSSSLREICVSPDGKYAYTVHVLSRYQMPTTQLERGWMNTNALSIIDAAGKKLINTVLLDDIDLGGANPWGVAITADGKTLCITHAGTHELSVVDTVALMDKLAAVPANEEEARKAGRYDNPSAYSSVTVNDVPNDLAFLVNVRRRIRLQNVDSWGFAADQADINGPRGLAVVGNKAYAAIYFSDALVAVDLEPRPGKVTTKLPLGPKPELTIQRRGEINFHDAALCFQKWQSCASCHPDIRVDGFNWDLMNDGMGNPKNTKSMLLSHKTPPAMSAAVRETAETAVRAGITHIQFAVRPEEDAVAIDEFLKALEPVPSPHLVNGQLSEAAQRGKALFFSDRVGCHACHPEPLYTDLKMHAVNSRGQYDRRDDFDTPTLIESWRTAPYLHDGSYTTMKKLIVEGKHGDVSGQIDSLSEQEVNDLVEFVLSL